ncbi:hypothetical protein [Fusibacter sp. 3D3]|uniref:hypothetical protein n=1 Tax=Fusibacter sp. 3D3 TaxID=1048380 RepID=UPI000853A37B|nr:hypothetical protein [Fusibacter sp. 3D3]
MKSDIVITKGSKICYGLSLILAIVVAITGDYYIYFFEILCLASLLGIISSWMKEKKWGKIIVHGGIFLLSGIVIWFILVTGIVATVIYY